VLRCCSAKYIEVQIHGGERRVEVLIVYIIV
jgi:hypothetical protein